MEEVQVLFEYKESRWQLTLSPPAVVCEVVSEELGKFGYATPVVKFSTPESSSASIQSPGNEYLLQRWSQQREVYIEESRRIREEQDRAFAESLEIDRAKDRAKVGTTKQLCSSL